MSYEQIMSSFMSNNEKHLNSRNSTSAENLAVVEATEDDVVFGRGKGCMNRNGNKRFRMIVNLYRGQYMSASRGDKRYVTQTVLKIIKTMDGRFLEQNSSTRAFKEVSDKRAFDKVSHTLRETKNVKRSTSKLSAEEELVIRQQQIFCDLLAEDINEMEEEEVFEDGTSSLPQEQANNSFMEYAEDVITPQEQANHGTFPGQLSFDNWREQDLSSQIEDLSSQIVDSLYRERIQLDSLIHDVGFPEFQTCSS